MTSAAELLSGLRDKNWTIATCESLTGGLLAGALIEPAGASAVVRGGLVTYATDLKASLAGVDAALLESSGTVSSAVALEMAAGARRCCGADVGVATTGVAGPDPVGRASVGTVWVAVVTPTTTLARRLRLTGDRAEIRHGAVVAALGLVAGALAQPEAPGANTVARPSVGE